MSIANKILVCVQTYIDNRVDTVILKFISKRLLETTEKKMIEEIEALRLSYKADEMLGAEINDLNLEDKAERMVQEAVENLECEDHLEASINDLKLDRMAEDKIDQELEDALDDAKNNFDLEAKVEEMVAVGAIEKLLNIIIERQLTLNLLGKRFIIKIEGEK